MFIIDLSATYKWPVELSFPIDGGKFDKKKITVEFKRLEQREIQELLDRENASDAGFAKAVVVGWADVYDSEKQPVEFTPSAFESFLSIPGAGAAVVYAFMDSINGGLKRKN